MAKRIVTSVIIASFIGDIDNKITMYSIAAVIVLAAIIIGILLLKEADKENKQKKGKKK